MRLRILAVVILSACSDAAGTEQPPNGETELRLVTVASGLAAPVHLTAPPGDDRLFVVEQAGRIRIIEDGQLRDEPFLDLTDRVGAGGERGLLSMAFHPTYAANGTFFVYYTDRGGDTRVERFTVSADPTSADVSSGTLVLAVDQPFANHNGGLILFGPDGMLYIGLGDGGSGGDPRGNGQNPQTLLGSILRIDVDGATPYAVPPDNPFATGSGGRPEVWAYGLRNPWRFSIDAAAGDLYIADVGQARWEEVNVVDADDAGLNFGWNVMEGTHCFNAASCETEGFVQPVLEYDHDDGCSITGGTVYRGTAIPGMAGHYFYGDFCGGWVRSFRWDDSAVRDEREWPFGNIGRIYSFGEDAAGEVYVLAGGAQGTVYRIEPSS